MRFGVFDYGDNRVVTMKYYVISIKILHLLYDLLPDLIVPEHKYAGKSGLVQEWRTEGSFLNGGIASGARAGDVAITRVNQRQNTRKSVYTH